MKRSTTEERRKAERRWDGYGELRMMAEVDGWVMLRRPGKTPFVMSRDAWNKLLKVNPASPVHRGVFPAPKIRGVA
jgi:hypothetical protein